MCAFKKWFSKPDKILEHNDYQRAVEFKEGFTPKEGCDYKWIWSYAEQLLERLETTYRELDGKADSIIRYLGGGVGLLTIGAIASISKDNAFVVGWTIPSFLTALAAIWCAARARTPSSTQIPPPIDGAIKYAEAYSEEAQSTFLAQWHLVCVGARIAILAKASYVQWATGLFFVTVAGLSLPLFAAVHAALNSPVARP